MVPLRERKWFFAMLVLVPSVVWPGLSLLWLLLPWTQIFGLLSLLIYEWPPLVMAYMLGLVGESGPNFLFGGSSIPVPAFPWGWLYCSFFWALTGVALWVALGGLRRIIRKWRKGGMWFDPS